MKPRTNMTRWITAGLVAATVLSLASTAFADHGGRRYKGVAGGFPGQRVIVREHSSSAGPAIAGLIGGFLLANALSANAHPAVVHQHYCPPPPVVEYRYYDPYGDDWYDSLDQCSSGYRHPRVIEVIDVRSGRHVRTLRYVEGGWQRVSGDYDYRSDGDHHDRGDDD